MNTVKTKDVCSVAIPGIFELPASYRVVKVTLAYVEAIRKDGLRVFFDRSEDELSCMLNHIRIYGSREYVILCVGLIRGMQITRNYAEKWAKDLLPDIEAKRIEFIRTGQVQVDCERIK